MLRDSRDFLIDNRQLMERRPALLERAHELFRLKKEDGSFYDDHLECELAKWIGDYLAYLTLLDVVRGEPRLKIRLLNDESNRLYSVVDAGNPGRLLDTQEKLATVAEAYMRKAVLKIEQSIEQKTRLLPISESSIYEHLIYLISKGKYEEPYYHRGRAPFRELGIEGISVQVLA